MVLLFGVAASIPLACCAGVVDLHGAAPADGAAVASDARCAGGDDCCERAAFAPEARRCCEGGQAFEGLHQMAWAPALDPIFSSGAVPGVLAPQIPELASAFDAAVRGGPLYTHHSVLLI